jgi:hypothetical protein
MKTLQPKQYAFLIALKQGNYKSADNLAYDLPASELYSRGLYTYEPHQGDVRFMVLESARIAIAGLTAIRCYQAIHGTLINYG